MHIWDMEFEKAMEMHKEKAAVVVAIIISSCDWTGSPFTQLNGLPIKGVPITKFADWNGGFSFQYFNWL